MLGARIQLQGEVVTGISGLDAWLTREGPEFSFDPHNPFEAMATHVTASEGTLSIARKLADRDVPHLSEAMQRFVDTGLEEGYGIFDWRLGEDCEPLVMLPGWMQEEAEQIAAVLNGTVPDVHCVAEHGSCRICRDLVTLPAERITFEKLADGSHRMVLHGCEPDEEEPMKR